MAGTVINDRFQAQFGFESPKYTVDTAGKITAETLDVRTILLAGKSFVQAADDDQTGDDKQSIQKMLSSIASLEDTISLLEAVTLNQD